MHKIKQQLNKIITTIILLVVSTMFVGCNSIKFYLCDNYAEFVVNYKIYDEASEIPPKEPALPEREEIVDIGSLCKIYDYAVDDASVFFGEYSNINIDGKTYFIDKNGQIYDNRLHSTISDIVIVDYKYDKVIVRKGDRLGVVDIFGNILVDCLYDYIEIYKYLIVCGLNNESYIYKNNYYLGKINGDVFIIDENIILNNDVFLWTNNLKLAKINEFFVSDAAVDGLFVVKSENGLTGFYNYIEDELIIEPKYYTGFVISSDYFCVYDYDPGKIENGFCDFPKIINQNNEVLFDFATLYSSEFLFNPLDVNVYSTINDTIAFEIGNKCGIIDVNNGFNCEIYSFNLKFSMAFGDYLISDKNRLFSLSNGEFVGDIYDKILPFGEYFIVKINGFYSIIDQNLTVLVENCKEILPYEDTVVIYKNGNYSLYKR